MLHGLPQRSLVVVVEFGRTTWKNLTYGDAEFKKAKYCFTAGCGSTAMNNGEYAITFVLNGGEQDATYMYFELQDISYPERKNGTSDSLAKTARSFHKELCYIGCYILIWLPRPSHMFE
ncbi:hypothetical protein DY000_02002891 [Brassica cretica]|uniref:Uncharacterized protein n=1 Tax=Brassica cretica TaxID=69181 RepID=A0ABQ7BV43_BRACR|nr:hypothetical protein DY000_02002891 [Brassica cretica]